MTKPYIIIIEDDPSLGEIYQAALERIGFEVDLDKMGNQFKRMLESRIPTLVILDLHMPYIRGEDVLLELHSNECWKDIPIVITTADLVLAKKLEGKADHILIKPVSAARLRGIATDLLSSFRQHP